MDGEIDYLVCVGSGVFNPDLALVQRDTANFPGHRGYFSPGLHVVDEPLSVSSNHALWLAVVCHARRSGCSPSGLAKARGATTVAVDPQLCIDTKRLMIAGTKLVGRFHNAAVLFKKLRRQLFFQLIKTFGVPRFASFAKAVTA